MTQAPCAIQAVLQSILCVLCIGLFLMAFVPGGLCALGDLRDFSYTAARRPLRNSGNPPSNTRDNVAGSGTTWSFM